MSIPAAFNVACDAASRMLQEVQASGLSISSEAIFLIVLATILGEFVLSELASFLNYRALDTPMPKEFDGIYKPDAYAESQRYTKAKTIFGLLNKSFDLALLLVFWLVFDGFELVDGVVRSAVPGDSAESPSLDIWRGLLYMAIFGVGEGVLGLPWSIYFTFVLEEKFGFNKTTAKTFVVDLLKGLMLGVVLGAPLMAAVLAFFIYSGDRAWWLCWCFIAAFQIVVMFVAPVLIFPLFNEFTPLPEGELKEAIARYATSVGFTYGGIFEIDGAPLPGGTSEPSDQQQQVFRLNASATRQSRALAPRYRRLEALVALERLLHRLRLDEADRALRHASQADEHHRDPRRPRARGEPYSFLRGPRCARQLTMHTHASHANSPSLIPHPLSRFTRQLPNHLVPHPLRPTYTRWGTRSAATSSWASRRASRTCS